MQQVTKQKVIWLHDKGKNTVARDEMIGDLLNAVAGWNNVRLLGFYSSSLFDVWCLLGVIPIGRGKL